MNNSHIISSLKISEYILFFFCIPMRTQSFFLLIEIQFDPFDFIENVFRFSVCVCVYVFVWLCAHSSCGCSFFLFFPLQSKNHHSLLCLRLNANNTVCGKATETIDRQSKWIFICSFSNFISLARTKWKLIVQKLIKKKFRGTENAFNSPTHLIALSLPQYRRQCGANFGFWCRSLLNRVFESHFKAVKEDEIGNGEHDFFTQNVRKLHRIFRQINVLAFLFVCVTTRAPNSRTYSRLLYCDSPPLKWIRAERKTRTAINWKRNIDQENHHHAIISNRSGHHDAFFLLLLCSLFHVQPTCGMYQTVCSGVKAATRAFSFKILIITCCYPWRRSSRRRENGADTLFARTHSHHFGATVQKPC